MPSVLQNKNIRFYSTTPYLYREDLELRRIDRLDLIWKIANRVWDDYKTQPSGIETDVWEGIVSRFTVTDLQTPVQKTISSASHGGKVTRRIKKATNIKELEEIVNSDEYDTFIKESANPEAILYGTSYGALGWSGDKFRIVPLPPVSTQIITSDTDVDDVVAVVSDYGNKVKSFETDGCYVGQSQLDNMQLLPDTSYGFIPVGIFRGYKADVSSPYGIEMVWAATQETVQVTYLMNDIMVLERLQSFSTLVIEGNEAANANRREGHGPFAIIRLQANTSDSRNGAYYISPQAAIDQVNVLIESKFERAAVQCQIPVEVFTRQKSGVNQSAGSSHLTHKPLYDLVVFIQEQRRREEIEFIARIDAMISWLKGGKVPQDLDSHIKRLEVEISYEREENPAFNQADAQTYEMLLSSNFIDHRTAFYKFNPDGTDELQKELEGKREKDRTVSMDMPGIVGNKPQDKAQEQKKPKKKE